MCAEADHGCPEKMVDSERTRFKAQIDEFEAKVAVLQRGSEAGNEA